MALGWLHLQGVAETAVGQLLSLCCVCIVFNFRSLNHLMIAPLRSSIRFDIVIKIIIIKDYLLLILFRLIPKFLSLI